MAQLPATARFQKLVDDISRMYVNARRAQVRFAWETGRRIVQEEQNGAMRAKYGAGLIPELSKKLSKKYGPGFSKRTLQKMRYFYTHHSIAPTSAQLDWSDYVELMPVRDEQKRKRLEQRILKEGLNSGEIRQEVRRLRRAAEKDPVPALPPLRSPADLRLNTFALSSLRVKLRKGYVLVDCGFFVSWPVKKEELKGLDLNGMSYTYGATVERVVDGDTLLVLIEAGFGIIVRERLRLRGVNCPEKGTPEGDRAWKFVQKLLPAGSVIVLKTHKCRTDIYGRFVADVFFKKGIEDTREVIQDGIYLNQLLLDEGHAVRMEW